MPQFQRIAALLVHSLRKQGIFPILRHRQFDLTDPFRTVDIPEYPRIAGITLYDQRIIIPVDAISAKELYLLVKIKGPERRLGDISVCHHTEAAVEKGIRHALLLKHISEGPVGIRFVHIPQAGKLSCQIRRIEIGIMDDSLRRIGSTELCQVDRQIPVFFKGIHDIPGGLQIGKAHLRIFQPGIIVMSDPLGKLHRIMMSCDHIRTDALPAAKLQESLCPFRILHAADSRSAHFKAIIVRFDRRKGFLEKLKILFPVCLVPEPGQIGLIPHFDRPGAHFIPVTLFQVLEQRDHHIRPLAVILRRCGISLPVKDRLRSTGQLPRHKAQFQIRPDPQLQICVKDTVDVGVVVLYLCLAVFLILMIDRHII